MARISSRSVPPSTILWSFREPGSSGARTSEAEHAGRTVGLRDVRAYPSSTRKEAANRAAGSRELSIGSNGGCQGSSHLSGQRSRTTETHKSPTLGSLSRRLADGFVDLD